VIYVQYMKKDVLNMEVANSVVLYILESISSNESYIEQANNIVRLKITNIYASNFQM